MNLIFSRANKHIKKLLNEAIKNQVLYIGRNKIVVPSFEVTYNKGSEIEETMTDREILLQLARDMKIVKSDIVEIKQDVKDMKNTPTMKRELKAMGK